MNKEIAILMAAGMGTRMRPLTEHTAKPLVKVNNKPLIETVIDALVKRDIAHIYIVTGYLKEQFEYLTGKYGNVTLIENREYRIKNNISSLYATGDILGSADCFICEADLYVADDNIFLREFKDSCYFGKRFSGYSDDWVFEASDDRITRIGKCGTDTYNMAGISYWKREDAATIRAAIAEAYTKEGHETLFWDEIVDKILDDIYVTIEDIPIGSVTEVDTVEELRELEVSLNN